MSDQASVAEPSDSIPTPLDDAGERLAGLLNDLRSEDGATRLRAVKELGRPETASREALLALERAVAQDRSDQVREAALQALRAPAYRALQRRARNLSPSFRQAIIREISQWVTDGLVAPDTARLLKQRYVFAAPQPQVPVAKPPKKPRPTLSQALFDETTIKVALYLGAFFVVSASFILAAIIAAARLPILLLVTVGFLGTFLLLKRRMPQASFTLFAGFAFMLPIDAGVLQDILNLDTALVKPYWMMITLFLSLLWILGTFLYRSRFFSMLALVAGSLSAILFGRWIDWVSHLDLFLVGMVTVAGLGGAFVLKRWQGERFSLPLFILAQCQQVGLLGLSCMALLFALISQESPAAGVWVVISGTWLLGTLFFAASHRLTPFPLFPFLAVVSLLPVPLFFSGVFSPTFPTVWAIAWVWGIVLTLGGEGLGALRIEGLRVYNVPLLCGSAVLFGLAAIGGLEDEVAVGMGYLMGTTVVYLALTIYRPRGPVWFGALVAAVTAYFSSFSLPVLEQYDFYPGFVLLWPTLVLLGMNLIARRAFKAAAAWHLPPLILACIIGAWEVLVLLASGSEPVKAAIAFWIFGCFFVLFGLVDKKPKVGYGATASLAMALVFVLVRLDQGTWLLPFVGLVSVYFLGGLPLAYLKGAGGWARVLRVSGLGLGFLISLSAPFQGGAAAIIGITVVAAYFTVEAFRMRNAWMGFPANFLYLGAYFMALAELEVTEPQYYSIGAAMLGLIMHYLLVRSGSRQGAFFTGLVSQLILLSTTYIQMLATGRFLFLLILFLQALAVLVYGLVVRAKSLVIVPIVFSVIGVISVAFSVLAGVSTAILVGCTGLLLLMLGVLALLLRERLVAVADKLGEKLGGWRG